VARPDVPSARPAAPPFPGFDPERAPNGRPWRPAAVLFVLYARDGELYTVFTRRAATMSNHRGQISLPGGGYEPRDGSLVRTALRETHEELGVPPEDVVVLAELEPEYVGVSGFRVTPFVGRLARAPDFRPDPREVEAVLEIPMALLQDPAICREAEHDRGVYIRRGPVYQCNEHEIWGATARMLQRILAQPAFASWLAVPP
jgi:8-oxo-dGTP pyrophosphatase MutT (NUDIX family)